MITAYLVGIICGIALTYTGLAYLAGDGSGTDMPTVASSEMCGND